MKRIFQLILALILAVIGYMFWQNTQLPDHVGLKDGRFSALPTSPNAVSSQTEETERKVAPLPAKDDEAATVKAIETALGAMETVEKHQIVTSENGYMHVIFTTPTMGYNDDVEFLIDQSAGLVHFRSQSRVGYSDRGANRARYEAFVKAYDE